MVLLLYSGMATVAEIDSCNTFALLHILLTHSNCLSGLPRIREHGLSKFCCVDASSDDYNDDEQGRVAVGVKQLLFCFCCS